MHFKTTFLIEATFCSCFTEFCGFLSYINKNQPEVHPCPLPPIFLPTTLQPVTEPLFEFPESYSKFPIYPQYPLCTLWIFPENFARKVTERMLIALVWVNYSTLKNSHPWKSHLPEKVHRDRTSLGHQPVPVMGKVAFLHQGMESSGIHRTANSGGQWHWSETL